MFFCVFRRFLVKMGRIYLSDIQFLVVMTAVESPCATMKYAAASPACSSIFWASSAPSTMHAVANASARIHEEATTVALSRLCCTG